MERVTQRAPRDAARELADKSGWGVGRLVRVGLDGKRDENGTALLRERDALSRYRALVHVSKR